MEEERECTRHGEVIHRGFPFFRIEVILGEEEF